MQHYIDLTQLLLSMTFPVALGRACSGSKILQGLYASNTSYPHDLNLQGPDSVPVVCHTRSFALKVSRCRLTCMLRICFCFLHVWRRWFAVARAMYVCGCFPARVRHRFRLPPRNRCFLHNDLGEVASHHVPEKLVNS